MLKFEINLFMANADTNLNPKNLISKSVTFSHENMGTNNGCIAIVLSRKEQAFSVDDNTS